MIVSAVLGSAYLTAHWQSLMVGGTATYVLCTIAKWLPVWPLTWEKMYNWIRNSVQDVASHYQGGPGNTGTGSGPQNPIKPA
jgi:hypothetical protein